jgi:predicted nucleic acid-binding protein
VLRDASFGGDGLQPEFQSERWGDLRDAISLTIGPRTPDARIAALCIANRITTLWTADRDFSRFPQVRVANPLVG